MLFFFVALRLLFCIQLGSRLLHILKRLLPISVYLLQVGPLLIILAVAVLTHVLMNDSIWVMLKSKN